MASTRRAPVQKSKKLATETDIDDFLAIMSQQSGSDDDAAIRVMIAKRKMASSEKKRTEKEKQFNQATKKDYQDIITSSTDEALESMQNMDDTFAKFILDYAASEDTTRELWFRIENERRTLGNLVKECLRTNMERIKATENGQIQGMALAKQACEDCKTIVSSLEYSASSQCSFQSYS